MIIVSSLELSYEFGLVNDRFSEVYHSYFANYTYYYKNKNISIRFPASDFYIRQINPEFIEIGVMIYLLGMLLREFKKVILNGVKEYVFSWNNLFISLITILFICSFALKYYTNIQVNFEREKLNDPKLV